MQMSASDPKITILPLVGVALGWFLAQATGLIKEIWNRHRVRKCLVEELDELHNELRRTQLQYARQLQIHALQGIDNGVPLKLSNHIFENFYKDAVLSLNQHQRISFQMIHSQVEALNSGISELEATARRLGEKATLEGLQSITPAEGELWGNQVIAGFTNAAAAMWLITNHLRNPRNPDLSLWETAHTDYLKYLQAVDDEIREILTAGKKLNRADFERAYRPEDLVQKLTPLAVEKPAS
jgi:hypothetical protein